MVLPGTPPLAVVGGLMFDENPRTAHSEEPFLEINTHEDEGGSSTLIFIFSIIIIIIVSGFFVYYKYRTQSQALDRQQALESTLNQLNSNNNEAVEETARNINQATTILSTAARSKFLFDAFITDLAHKITNDSKLNSLAISETGDLTIDGVGGSYRSVADLAISLQSSPKLDNIQIAGLSESTDGGTSQVTFSMTGKIKDWKSSGGGE